ncbi:hypothetical protein SDC9_95738 [bioreactor metagenome]|uniref:Uncharacterized protein n=1 Tax=bioreactor metagenome TaxID=1076179 RepID=A0A645A759_9ZZZZ
MFQRPLFGKIQSMVAHFGKPEQVTRIVIPATRDDDSALLQLSLLHKVIEHMLGHLSVVDKANRISLAALFDRGGEFLVQAAGNLIGQIVLAITGDLDGIGVVAIIGKCFEDIIELETDHILQIDDMVPTATGGQLHIASHGISGHFNQRIAEI